jgi:catechol 2,3-dioxygenase
MNIDDAISHYEKILGLRVTHRDSDGTAYLKCWDEWDKYSLILSESDRAGLNHLAFKTESDADLDAIAERIRGKGVKVETLAPGRLPMCGRSLKFNLPSGHEVRLFAEKECLGTAVGDKNPDPWPDGLTGIGVHWLDHLAIVCEFNPEAQVNKVAENVQFLVDTMDFKLTERAMVGPGGSVLMAAFLARTSTPHDIACVPGASMGLHHIAFYLDEWGDVLKAADIVAKARKQPALTPNRHGMTRGATYYVCDPSGNRNETFAGLGYLSQPDRPLVTWTEEDLERGMFFLGGTDRSFLEVYT